MEEYKYVLLENRTGDPALCRTFIDGLDAQARMYLYCITLAEGVLTLTWNRWTPPYWKRTKNMKLADGSDVEIRNEIQDPHKLPPSLEEALKILALAGQKKPDGSKTPDNFGEKFHLLDRLGFIDIDFRLELVQLGELLKDGTTLSYSKPPVSFAVTEYGKHYLANN